MVTIADVARHAGVAPSTVFCVVTGKRPISAETRSRVRDSIVELGYRPPAGVRSLRLDPPDVMALVLPLRDVHLPVVARLVTSIAVAAREHELDLLLVTADRDLAGLRRAAGSDRVGGFLVLDSEDAGERLRLLGEVGRSAVLIGQSGAGNGVTCVDLDFEAAGARCVDHLADLGHRSIGFLGAPAAGHSSGVARRTLAGFTAAAMRRGVVGTALGRESLVHPTTALLRAHPVVTALVVHDDSAAEQVPGDIAVVAIRPDEAAGQTSPFTSVQLSESDLGRRAVDLLVALAGGAVPPSLTLVPPRLVQRESCSLPGRRTAVVSTARFGGGRHDR
ncbi:DNA-binding LacI/PurR family transcriptional regulator [Lentzea atacamensis]|uniref:DNA-binding LacI/PurR family transcriptional regulator n=1 Tax=Lentzea atacamensis TaxID=531938 RepID=A0A316I521_9PSEU|nr:LacI family DNA-binding transcriptional regulator [Lentzea atacamensis]PWK85523.1 DNA-binding LacI/PurR family transcriptional regulator [Lentzea atacamensis]